MFNNKVKITNSNKKIYDWMLELAQDLRQAAKNLNTSKNKLYSHDAIVEEFKRLSRNHIPVFNYNTGIDLSGVYFIDNLGNKNYIFLIIKCEELVPVDNNTKNWENITVNDYLISLTENIINDQVERLSYEKKMTDKHSKELQIKINKTISYFNKAAAKYSKIAKMGSNSLLRDIDDNLVDKPINFDLDDEFEDEKPVKKAKKKSK